MKLPKVTARHPLHVHIATLFIVFIVAIGLALVWFNYRQNTKIILAASEQLVEHITEDVRDEFVDIYRAAASTIDLMSLSSVMAARTLDDRMRTLPLFQEALKDAQALTGIQVGYDDGDYFIVRPLNTDYLLERFAAPRGSAFVVDNIAGDESGQRMLLRIFLDDELREVERDEPVKTSYDPRIRRWYKASERPGQTVATNPFLYYFVRKVGITVGRRSEQGDAVIAADITLDTLSDVLVRDEIAPSAELVLFSTHGKVLAYRDPSKIVRLKPKSIASIASVARLGSRVLREHARFFRPGNKKFFFKFDGRRWRGTVQDLRITDSIIVHLGLVVPEDELLAQADSIRRQSTLITFGILLITLPLAWLIARQLTVPLRTLAKETERIKGFDFDDPIETRSIIFEIDNLADAMRVMKSTVHKFLTLIRSLAGEQDFNKMLMLIADETLDISQTDGVAIYLLSDDERSLEPFAWRTRSHEEVAFSLPPIDLVDDGAGSPFLSLVRDGQAGSVMVRAGEAGNHALVELMLHDLDVNAMELICIPLHDRKNEVSGVLLIAHQVSADIESEKLEEEHVGFVKALSGFSAVSLENQRLFKGQKDLLESFIKLIASAIDAKSAYTAGHCQRVPVLTKMLAEEACKSQVPPFDDFDLNEEQWEALYTASWLHDCGKVTTPEYVVDKATKLETIYDRLHEVRMRFEVLKCQAEIDYWKGVVESGEGETLRERLEDDWKQLDDDFAFVASCNQGGEFMAPELIERLKGIAERKWRRTLSDRIGLSWSETDRRSRTPEVAVPVDESLLADRPDHVIERDGAKTLSENNEWGFKLDVPEHEYNLGEVYNLSIGRGTLTAEERYKINDHIVQTIIMLTELPYPRHLRSVPDIAGGHHEKMDGTGYPRRLKKDEMSATARMMAIADIFEALTADDRPYKKAKPLSVSLKIMAGMCKGNHIDPELFELFLTSGVYMEYAELYLSPDQIDEVSIEDYLPAAEKQPLEA